MEDEGRGRRRQALVGCARLILLKEAHEQNMMAAPRIAGLPFFFDYVGLQGHNGRKQGDGSLVSIYRIKLAPEGSDEYPSLWLLFTPQ